jgi:hypothetical protein
MTNQDDNKKAPSSTQSQSGDTQHLDRKKVGFMSDRNTSPLDMRIPKRLRFIVGDMDAVIDYDVRNYLVLGRKDDQSDKQVDVDFAPFGALDKGVSRYHAIIQITHDRLTIKDFNSSNGTLLNGALLKPMFAYRLRHGDELTLGGLRLHVHFMLVEATTD